MLKAIASVLAGKTGGRRDDPRELDRRILIATCVLLLEMANADDEFARSELDKIREILKKRLNLPDGEIDEILSIAGREQEDATDIWAYTNLINEHFEKPEKLRLIEMVWEIAYSDGRLDQYEDYLVHKLANLLHVNHDELIAAKLKVKGGGTD